MRLTDDRTGRTAELSPAHRGLLRVRVHAGSPQRPFDLSDLRALLTADVLRRVCELGGNQVDAVLRLPDAPAEQLTAFGRDADLLGIYLPGSDAPDGPADVRVVAEHAAVGDTPDGIVIGTGPALAPPPGDGAPRALGFLEDLDVEPLAVRLALLSHAHRAPVALTRRMLTDAQKTLRQWRNLVADWAQEPSRPALADPVRRALAALERDLDVTAALSELDRLTAGPEPEGARFETFVRLDRVLGLELPGLIGQADPPPPRSF
ncbi:hypothetical protein [Kitasatospora sp. GP82]|uniref:hypothetical protein n=1 Tax=Kitasatospora sp. GP82 TaxID=3035089 RepID=UPI0024751CEA|nr:hypothetical protein [Kitasatospora sp. GP82]